MESKIKQVEANTLYSNGNKGLRRVLKVKGTGAATRITYRQEARWGHQGEPKVGSKRDCSLASFLTWAVSKVRG